MLRWTKIFLCAFVFLVALSDIGHAESSASNDLIDLSNGFKVTETVTSLNGSIEYKGTKDVTVKIRKPFGDVGKQSVPVIAPSKSRQFWDSILKSVADILGEEYLADSREPSFERTANLLAPMQFPHTYVGMREYPHEVHIGWDGAIGMDPGFIAGKETNIKAQPYAVAFKLNGKGIEKSESLSILRGQLDNCLPNTD